MPFHKPCMSREGERERPSRHRAEKRFSDPKLVKCLFGTHLTAFITVDAVRQTRPNASSSALLLGMPLAVKDISSVNAFPSFRALYVIKLVADSVVSLLKPRPPVANQPSAVEALREKALLAHTAVHFGWPLLREWPVI